MRNATRTAARIDVERGSGKSAVVADGSVGRVVLGGYELHVFVAEAEIVERFLNQVCILVAHLPELGGGYADE